MVALLDGTKTKTINHTVSRVLKVGKIVSRNEAIALVALLDGTKIKSRRERAKIVNQDSTATKTGRFRAKIVNQDCTKTISRRFRAKIVNQDCTKTISRRVCAKRVDQVNSAWRVKPVVLSQVHTALFMLIANLLLGAEIYLTVPTTTTTTMGKISIRMNACVVMHRLPLIARYRQGCIVTPLAAAALQ